MHTIKIGDTYVSLSIRHHPADGPTRIKIVDDPVTTHGRYGFGKVTVVTLTPDGREIRRRRIGIERLHATAVTETGSQRTTGYARETTTS